MAGDRDERVYARVRRNGAYLIIGSVVFLLVADSLRTDFDINPLILTPLLIFAAGLLDVSAGVLSRLNGGKGDEPDAD